jgi:8-amino-7-oxononanoate synthase
LTYGQDVDLVMGTFSKGLGAMGAYVAGSRLLIDYLVNACGGFIFRRPPRPRCWGRWMRRSIWCPIWIVNGRFWPTTAPFRAHLNEAGIGTERSSTQIVPVIVGEAEAAVALAQDLTRAGMLAVAIRPPTVPPGTSRLRVALHADHARADVEALAQAIAARIGR